MTGSTGPFFNTYPAFDGVTGTDGGNVVVYLPSLNTTLNATGLTVYNSISTSETYDYTLTIQGVTGSYETFRNCLSFAVDGNTSNVTNLASSDVLFSGNFTNYTHFFSTNSVLSSNSDISSYNILGSQSVSGNPQSLGKEYVYLIADLFTGDYKFSSIFNNSKTVQDTINGSATTSNSLLNVVDTKLYNTGSSTYYSVSNAASNAGANASLITYEVLMDYATARFDETLFNEPTATFTQSTSLTSSSGAPTNYNAYHPPLLAGDIIEFGVTINIPSTQFAQTFASTAVSNTNNNLTVNTYANNVKSVSVLVQYILN